MKLVVCLDGTWNRPDAEHPTNVVKIARNLVNDFDSQIVYYDAGVGSGGTVDKIVGGATGYGIKKNIEQAYEFLVSNYSEGSDIYLFGFSRGAYTARSLGGLIYKCGLMKRQHAAKSEQALKHYYNGAHPDTTRISEFRDKYSATREVFFIGVWDTVGALGIPAGYFSEKISEWRNKFHDTKINPLVKHAYQAVALDERRESFEPTLWTRSDKAGPGQMLEQVWFPGVHSDVGGGYEDSYLSDLAFEWMQNKARSTGLLFKDEPRFKPDGDPLGTIHDSSKDWPLPKDHREVNIAEQGLKFHESVKARISGDPTYQPPNLMKGDWAELILNLPMG